MRLLGLLLALAIPFSPAFAGDGKEPPPPPPIPWDEIKNACQEYLNAFADKDPKKDTSIEMMTKKLEAHIKTKMDDASTTGQGISRDEAMRSIMFDWAAGHENDLKNEVPKVVLQACFYFVAFLNEGFDMPRQIKDRIKTVADANQVIKSLRDEVENKNKAKTASDKKEKPKETAQLVVRPD